MSDTVTLSCDDALTLATAAAIGAGAIPPTAAAIARAAVAAEADGQPNVGLAHLVDYCEALAGGRIDGQAEPEITRPLPAIFLADARRGAAHPGFDQAFEDLAAAARTFGLAAFAQRNSYTCGALGYFTARLAERGLVALAATNGPALLAGSGATRPVYCTNPLSFAAPQSDGPPLVIDQASSATAFVNIRQAAAEGQEIPPGWALDESGRPTIDAAAAVKGALLAFGGWRGANIALMVEVLAAGLTGANWSLDAPSFTSGSESPGSGLFVLALEPRLFSPKFTVRLAQQLGRLANDYGVHIPGRRRAAAGPVQEISLPAEIHRQIAAWAARAGAGKSG